MLLVVNESPVAELAGRQQIRVTASGDRPRLEAHHAAKSDTGRAQLATRHRHDPVDAAGLGCTPMFRRVLVQQLKKQVAVQHDLPAASCP